MLVVFSVVGIQLMIIGVAKHGLVFCLGMLLLNKLVAAQPTLLLLHDPYKHGCCCCYCVLINWLAVLSSLLRYHRIAIAVSLAESLSVLSLSLSVSAIAVSPTLSLRHSRHSQLPTLRHHYRAPPREGCSGQLIQIRFWWIWVPLIGFFSPSPSNLSLSSTVQEGDYCDNPHSLPLVPYKSAHLEDNVSSGTAPKSEQSKQEIMFSQEVHQYPFVHIGPNYGFPFLQPMLGSQLVQCEGPESQLLLKVWICSKS